MAVHLLWAPLFVWSQIVAQIAAHDLFFLGAQSLLSKVGSAFRAKFKIG